MKIRTQKLSTATLFLLGTHSIFANSSISTELETKPLVRENLEISISQTFATLHAQKNFKTLDLKGYNFKFSQAHTLPNSFVIESSLNINQFSNRSKSNQMGLIQDEIHTDVKTVNLISFGPGVTFGRQFRVNSSFSIIPNLSVDFAIGKYSDSYSQLDTKNTLNALYFKQSLSLGAKFLIKNKYAPYFKYEMSSYGFEKKADLNKTTAGVTQKSTPDAFPKKISSTTLSVGIGIYF